MCLDQEDNRYPRGLRNIVRPPAVLYYQGDIGILSQGRTIAVIGSRHVSHKGIALAYQTGYVLAKRGVNVLNGLALGCDTHALEGALAAGGRCIAVMPCGLGQIVPKSNAGLVRKLLSRGGCVVSEYPDGTPVRKYQYVARDRLQSGISDGVIVIEAGCESGTMHTVENAFRQGKYLACYDGGLLEYASGNRWMEDRMGVEVLKDMDDLDSFLDRVGTAMEYRQIALHEIL